MEWLFCGVEETESDPLWWCRLLDLLPSGELRRTEVTSGWMVSFGCWNVNLLDVLMGSAIIVGRWFQIIDNHYHLCRGERLISLPVNQRWSLIAADSGRSVW